MLSISSKPLSAGQARMYYARKFTSEKQNYWSQDQQGHSEWQGQLAEKWDLKGSVSNEEYARLTEGQHSWNGEQLVRQCLKKPKQIRSAENSQAFSTTPAEMGLSSC